MFRTRTVFIVGAGASVDLGFPIGTKLLTDIGLAFEYRQDSFGEAEGGNSAYWRQIRTIASQAGHATLPYLKAAQRVRDASYLGLSIDNVIHQQNDDELFVLCAKIAIAGEILAAEARSDLRVPENQLQVIWPAARSTWLGGFAQLLVQDVEKHGLDTIFDQISVISFNYDRTLRRFLPFALSSQFAIPLRDAEALSTRLRIYHPYGSLGKLPFEGSPSVEFGDDSSLERVSRNIRTFTEQIEDDDSLEEMQRSLSDADRIVFLGFGYLAQNMELLRRSVDGNASSVMGTSYGLSEPDQNLVSGNLSYFFREPLRAHKSAILSPTDCNTFIRQNFRTLTS